MKIGLPRTSARSSRRQLSIYLEAGLRDRIRQEVESTGRTLQEVLAETVDDRIESMSGRRILNCMPLGTRRQVSARPRDLGALSNRSGMVVVSGWYDRKAVEDLRSFAAGRSTTMQSFVVDALERRFRAS